jgi:proteasome activator subunit 4
MVAAILCRPPNRLGESVVKLAKEARRFFPPSSTGEILATLRPLLCPHDETCFRGVAFLAALLPTDENAPAAASEDFLVWVDELFHVWKWLGNSPDWDFAFYMLFARVAKENPGRVDWQPHMQWLCNKILGSFGLPVGSKGAPQPYTYRMPGTVMLLIPGHRAKITKIAVLLIYMIGPKNGMMLQIKRLLESMKAFFHPSNTGSWTSRLSSFMYKLCEVFAMRTREEARTDSLIPEGWRLSETHWLEFVQMLKPYVFLAQFSKSQNMVTTAAWALRHLAYLAPAEILPPLMERVYPALETLTETHQTFAALSALAAVVRPLLWTEHYPQGLKHLVPLLQLTLPGIDPNDATKTQVTLQFLMGVFMNVYLIDCSQHPAPACAGKEEIEALQATSYFEDWSLQFLDRIFCVLETMVPASNKRHTTEGSLCEWIEYVCFDFFRQISPPIYELVIQKLFRWTNSNIIVHIGKTAGTICAGAAMANPALMLRTFLAPFCTRALEMMAVHETIEEAAASEAGEGTTVDDELLWCLHIMSRVVKQTGEALLEHSDLIVQVLTRGLRLKWQKAAKFCGKMLRHVLVALTWTYPVDRSTVTVAQQATWASDPVGLYSNRGNSPAVLSASELDVRWHIATAAELDFAEHLIELFYNPAVSSIEHFLAGRREYDRSVMLADLAVVRNCARVGLSLFPEPTAKATHHFINSSKTYVAHHKLRLTAADASNTSRFGTKRQELKQMVHRLVAQLLAKCEDDTKVFKVTIKIMFQLLCVRGITERKFSRATRSWSYNKQGSADLVREGKRYSRVMLIHRVQLQHQRRLSKRRVASPYDDDHQSLVVDLTTLGTSRYAIVRRRAQEVLSSVTSIFPLAKDECFHLTVQKLAIPAEQMDEKHQQIKGALYILSTRIMARFVLQNLDYVGILTNSVVGLHANQRPSVQTLVNCLFSACHQEFRHTTFGSLVPAECMAAVKNLWPMVADLQETFDGASVEEHGRQITETSASYHQLLVNLSELLEGSSVSWKFELLVAGLLSLFLRENLAVPPNVVTYYIQGLASDSLRMRHLATKVSSMIVARCKLRPAKANIYCDHDQSGPVYTPLPATAATNERVPVYGFRKDNAGHCFKVDPAERPLTAESFNETVFVDKNYTAWNTWPMVLKTYLPRAEQPDLQPNEQIVLTWDVLTEEGLIESHIELFSQDKADGSAARFNDIRAELYKGLARNHGVAVIDLLKSHIEKLYELCDTDGVSETTSKHRCASEMLAGMIRGSKHWPCADLEQLWSWLIPLLKSALYSATHMTIGDFTSMLRFYVYDRDPRRFYPVTDLIFEPQSLSVDEGDTTFAQCRYLEYHITVLEELSWRGAEQAMVLLALITPYVAHPYKLVREKLARALYVILRAVWVPGGTPHPKITSFVEDLRDVVLSGQSMQDSAVKKSSVLAAKTLLKWMLLTYYEGSSPSLEPYAAKLVRAVFVAAELSPEDDELAGLCRQSIGYMSQTVLGPDYAESMFLAAIEVTKDESWHVRERALMYLQVSMFRNLFLVPKEALVACMVASLQDSQLEVQQLASVTLSGMLRCRLADDTLCGTFMELSMTPIRRRKRRRGASSAEKEPPLTAEEKSAIATRHAGLLGLQAFVTAFPYSIPDWMPAVLVYVSECIGDPDPIKACVKKTLSEFWRTHQDDKQALKDAFSEDQLQTVKDLVIGYNYYA